MIDFTLYTAYCSGNSGNCLYPNKKVISNKAELITATKTDHVTAKYKGNYRSKDNFEYSDCIPLDCDNDHSENSCDWITPFDLALEIPGVCFAASFSRSHMKNKGNKSPRPRFHVFFPIPVIKDVEEYTSLKRRIATEFPYFDINALDSARFLYGNDCSEVEIYNGDKTIVDFMEHDEFAEFDASIDEVPEGQRNSTMSHIAGKIIKRYGNTEEAYQLFLKKAEICKPPLPDSELNVIWHSAMKFGNKVSKQDGYIPPEQYNNTYILKPEDYSDIGEAKVLARECIDRLRFTSATDFITFEGDRWHEDKQKALGVVEEFMDKQLEDAGFAISVAEKSLIAIGISETDVKSRSKELAKKVPLNKIGLLYALLSADAYKKFVMKYRNYKNIVNTQNAAKPMLTVDVSKLDSNPHLLNTPSGTYDLTKGLDGLYEHTPDDLITKVTAVAPGDKGKQLWEDSLDLFFCGDKELIDYVQEIVGLSAVGKVYAEHMIIAYGGGANGKSTFWNTIARVLGNYSGKLSAEALTMSCKRNVKPEMAELKGKRLIIASELEEGTRLNTGMVKQLCSIDPIEAEKKYKDPFHFDPSHTLVLYTNHLPKVSANDDGTWRRLIVIPFNAKIIGQSDIKNYADYLFENAGPYIMTWIIEGAKIAIDKGYKFKEPRMVADAINSYREENDWLGHFLEEHCESDPSYEEKSGELYQTYRANCLLKGEYIRSTTDFYGSLEKAGYTRRRTSYGRFIVGLRLKEGQEFMD